MKQFIIKTFQKKKAVIVYVADEAGHLTQHWCVPDRDNRVRVNGLDKAVLISRETMRLSTKWNIPTFVVHHSNCESMNLDDPRASYYNADELRLILDNEEAHNVFNSSKSGVLSNESLILLAVVILGFLFISYFFNSKLNAIQTLVEPTAMVEVVL